MRCTSRGRKLCNRLERAHTLEWQNTPPPLSTVVEAPRKGAATIDVPEDDKRMINKRGLRQEAPQPKSPVMVEVR
jgi:hypothetical protein